VRVAQIANTSGKEKVKKSISSPKTVGLASLGSVGNSPKKAWSKGEGRIRESSVEVVSSPALEEEPSLEEGGLVPLRRDLTEYRTYTFCKEGKRPRQNFAVTAPESLKLKHLVMTVRHLALSQYKPDC